MNKDAGGGQVFSLPLQINYEDTDAGGVVYYANYLGYMERARNACLRRIGFPPSELAQRHSILFVVTEVRLNYLAAARLDDELIVTLEILHLRRASMVFRQQVRRDAPRDGRRDEQVLVDGEIKLALVNSDTFAPCRMPTELTDALGRLTD